MEQILKQLIDAINMLTSNIKQQYSSLNTNFSGIDNKLSDYSIFTIIQPKLTNYKIDLTFPRANYISTVISDSTTEISIGINSSGKQKLKYKDGSYFKGVISDIFITYDFTIYENAPQASIYIGYNSEFRPITTVKIDDLNVGNAMPVNVVSGEISVDSSPKTYTPVIQSNTINNEIVSFNLSQPTNSIMIKNTGTNSLFFGNISNTNDLSQAIEILAGEYLEIPFNPLCNSYSFNLASLASTSYSVIYNRITL